jgi:ABC-2 type transport system permease protein
MMLRNVFVKSLWDQKRSLVWWCLGIGLMIIITMLFYPSIREMTELNEIFATDENPLMKVFVGDITDITSPEGFVNSQLLIFMVPLLYLVFAIGIGSGSIAGEEEKGTLDFLLAHPLTRESVIVQKFLAMNFAVAWIGVFAWASLVIGAAIVDMEIGYSRLAAATFSGVLLGITYGGIAFLFGAAFGKRSLSIGITGALGIGGYLLNVLGPIVGWLEPFTKISPFYYYSSSDPLANGLDWSHMAVLLVVILLMGGMAILSFRRRDLAVG